MENIKTLEKLQKEYTKQMNINELNKINKMLYEIREKAKKEKARQNEIKRQEDFNKKIYEKLAR